MVSGTTYHILVMRYFMHIDSTEVLQNKYGLSRKPHHHPSPRPGVFSFIFLLDLNQEVNNILTNRVKGEGRRREEIDSFGP